MKHLPIPAKHIALGLNFDAIPPIGVPQSVNVTGAERTTFYPTVEKTAGRLWLRHTGRPGTGRGATTIDPTISASRVPAFRPSRVNAGVKFAGHPPQWGKAQIDDYTAKRYHSPGDEYLPSMDFSSNAALGKFGFALGWQALAGEGHRELVAG